MDGLLAFPDRDLMPGKKGNASRHPFIRNEKRLPAEVETVEARRSPETCGRPCGRVGLL